MKTKEKILKEKIENQAYQEKPCNHFMVWNIQGGYSYYRCDKCNYIDGKKTFSQVRAETKKEILEKIKKKWTHIFGNTKLLILNDILKEIDK